MSPIVLIHIVIIVVGLIFLGVILQSKKSEKNPTAQAKCTELIRPIEEESNEEQIKIQQMLQAYKANNTQVRNVPSKRPEASCVFYQCPVCGSIFFTKIKQPWRDVIHIQAIYSDGMEVYDWDSRGLKSDPLKLTKCEKCGSIFSLNLLKELREIPLETLNGHDDSEIDILKDRLNSNIGEEEIHNILKIIDQCQESFKNKQERCEDLDIDDLYKALDSFPEEELTIRLRIWRKYNVYYWDHDEHFIQFIRPNLDPPLDSAEYQSNCRALLSLLNKEDYEERILLAEVNRNLGNFEECLNLISNLEFEERGRFIQELKEILIRECTKGNRRTVRTDNYFAILKEQAEQAEKERINEEMKDPRWKVCPNGHCFENIRKECIWCGEKTVVDRLDKDIDLQHKELYVGKQNGHYILTTNASIPMQNESIRKITVDYYKDKFVYFHLDGKNPNPFYFNALSLEQGGIGGRLLTKCCEDIVAGQSDSIDLSEQQEQLRQERRRQKRIKEIERKKTVSQLALFVASR